MDDIILLGFFNKNLGMKICGLDKCDNDKAAAAYAGSAAGVTSIARKVLLSFDILHRGCHVEPRELVLVPVPYILAKAAPCGVELVYVRQGIVWKKGSGDLCSAAARRYVIYAAAACVMMRYVGATCDSVCWNTDGRVVACFISMLVRTITIFRDSKVESSKLCCSCVARASDVFAHWTPNTEFKIGGFKRSVEVAIMYSGTGSETRDFA